MILGLFNFTTSELKSLREEGWGGDIHVPANAHCLTKDYSSVVVVLLSLASMIVRIVLALPK